MICVGHVKSEYTRRNLRATDIWMQKHLPVNTMFAVALKLVHYRESAAG